jgi:hypothetical protein
MQWSGSFGCPGGRIRPDNSATGINTCWQIHALILRPFPILLASCVTYPEFEARWRPAGGAERANYGLFLTDLCDLLGVARPDVTTDNPAQDAYVFERAVVFDDGAGKKSTGRIDLYKRSCFVCETKQGVGRLEEISQENEDETSTNKNTASAAARQRGSAAARQRGSA